MSISLFPFHAESSAIIFAPIAEVFTYLDDPKLLSSHMGKSSMMMLGSRMNTSVDAGAGQQVGSKIRIRGSVMGMSLALEEEIIERQAPYTKIWQTIGKPQLLLIANYRMGFEIVSTENVLQVHVFIDYCLPESAIGKLIGQMLAGVYARWCVQKMINDLVDHFK